MNTKNDLILRGDAIAALGDAPMNWTDTPEEIQAVNDWQAAIEACVPKKFLEINQKAFLLGRNTKLDGEN